MGIDRGARKKAVSKTKNHSTLPQEKNNVPFARERFGQRKGNYSPRKTSTGKLVTEIEFNFQDHNDELDTPDPAALTEAVINLSHKTESQKIMKNTSDYDDQTGMDMEVEKVRLQKFMANAGVASRRLSEEMITAGRVEVNGRAVTELGYKINPHFDKVAVDGMRIQANERMKYLVFNKPAGVVSTMSDPEGRPCISDYLAKYRGDRLFHVGRLDTDSEGLLILTNDGQTAHRLAHPSFEVPKTYLVQISGPLEKGVGNQLRSGLHLEDGVAKVDSFKVVDSNEGKILVEVVLHSGKKRIVRRMFKEVGYPVERLIRVKFGPIDMNDQKQGTVRGLGNQEVGHLLAEVGL